MKTKKPILESFYSPISVIPYLEKFIYKITYKILKDDLKSNVAETLWRNHPL